MGASARSLIASRYNSFNDRKLANAHLRGIESRRKEIPSAEGFYRQLLSGDERNMRKTWLYRTGVIGSFAVAALAFGSSAARAQGSMEAPFNKVTVSEDVAKRTLMKAAINADTARALVDACVEWTKAQGGNQSVVVYVLSPTGEIVDSHGMDGVLAIGAETGLMKAKTALYARRSSVAVAQRFKDLDGRLIRLD